MNYSSHKFPRREGVLAIRELKVSEESVFPHAIRPCSADNPDDIGADFVRRVILNRARRAQRYGMCARKQRCQRKIMRNVTNEFLTREKSLRLTGTLQTT